MAVKEDAKLELLRCVGGKRQEARGERKSGIEYEDADNDGMRFKFLGQKLS